MRIVQAGIGGGMVVVVLVGLSFFVIAETPDTLLNRSTSRLAVMEPSFTLSSEVRLVVRSVTDGSAEARWYPFGAPTIYLDPDDLQNLSDPALEGLLAHELSHLEVYDTLSSFALGVYAVRYLFSSSFRRQVEREADEHAIAHGFGSSLLAFRLYRMESATSRDRWFMERDYLSPDEIRDALARLNSSEPLLP